MANFNEAFRAARKSGKKVFSWNGKSYNTKLKSDSPKAKTPKPADKPKAKTPVNPDRKKDDVVAKPKGTGNVLDKPKSERPTPAADKIVDSAVSAVKGAVAAARSAVTKPTKIEAAKARAQKKLESSAVAKGTSQGPTKAEAKGAVDRAKVRALLKKKA